MMRLLFYFLLVLPVLADPLFLERGGLVVMEAEGTASRLKEWEKKQDVADYTGECHLEFTGNSITNGPPSSPLEYCFKIERAGVYSLLIRARKRLETERHDLSNDCYVAVEGEFTSGSEAPLEVLKKETKLFGGSPDRWGWASMLDEKHKKYKPRYQFQAGETYTLTISGRSKNFNMDRILFVHEEENVARLKEKQAPQSALAGQAEAAEKIRLKRTLTNRKGAAREAVLIKKKEGIVTALIEGRSYEIPIASLSDEDQLFLKDWPPTSQD